VFVVNEKFVSADRPWRVFEEAPENFPTLFARVRALTLDEDAPLGMRENAALLHFFIRCFQSVVRCGWPAKGSGIRNAALFHHALLTGGTLSRISSAFFLTLSHPYFLAYVS
jgi:hypothetical protein